MKKKHIFLLFSNLGLGGIQRKMVDLVNHVDGNKKYKNIVTHIVVKRRENFGFESQLPKNFKFFHVESDFHNRTGKLGYILFLGYLIFKYKPKILVPFLHSITTYTVLMKYLFFWKRMKIIVGQDNILSFENKFPYSTRIYSSRLLEFCYKRVDKIITQTSFAKNDLIKNFKVSDKKIVVIKNWLKKNKLVKSKKKYDLIYCGRFSAQKKLIKVLKIALLLKKESPGIKICLIGSGKEEKKIVAFIKNHNLENNVIIKPPTLSIIKEIARAKIFILTSDYEGHPMVLLEAMAQRVVSVVLKYPGLQEYLDHEKNGFLENSLNSMSKRIVRLLNDDNYLEKIGENSRKTVLTTFKSSLIDKTLESILL